MGRFNFDRWKKMKTAANKERRQDKDVPGEGQPSAAAGNPPKPVVKPRPAEANQPSAAAGTPQPAVDSPRPPVAGASAAQAPAAAAKVLMPKDDNIYEALNIFINAMRTFTIGVIKKNFPERPWNETFVKTLDSKQQKMWKHNAEKGTPVEYLIDYGNLVFLATNFRQELAKEIGGKSNTYSFQNCMNELRETRNWHQHFTPISSDDKERAYSNMVRVANIIHDKELHDAIVALRDKPQPQPQTAVQHEPLPEKEPVDNEKPADKPAPPQTDDKPLKADVRPPKASAGENGMIYDPEQEEVINAEGGLFLVLAPPGCGKTEVLSERIVRAARNNDVALGDMACLTFTNRASREMLDRVRKKVGDDAGMIYVGNIHKFCHAFLTDNGLMPGGVCMMGDDEMKAVIKEKCHVYDKDKIHDITKKTYIENANNFITLMELRLPVGELADAHEYAYCYEQAKSVGLEPSLLPEGLVKNILKYRQFKERNGLMTYADLLIWTYYYLHNDNEGKFKRYRWIEVDEVQDLTPLQMAIIDELADKSGRHTVMYLGDEQQAIFSFIGAKVETLERLRQKCEKLGGEGGGFKTLSVNHRSPQYLLDVFNAYANKNLGVSMALLPHTDWQEEHEAEDLRIVVSADKDSQYDDVAEIVKDYADRYPGDRTAIVVNKNDNADDISNSLSDIGVSHYKVSGNEVTASKTYRTLSSLMNVCARDGDNLSWARLISFLSAGKTFKSLSATIDFLSRMRTFHITPLDLMNGSTYASAFLKSFSEDEIVVMSVETTGTSILNDDIVKVDAVKMRHGTPVDGSRLRLFLDTGVEIPETLGGKPNPLFKEYAENKHLSREEGLGILLRYIGSEAVAGYNADIIVQTLRYNVVRSLQGLSADLATWNIGRLIRTVEPRLPSYRLERVAKSLNIDCEEGDKLAALTAIAAHCAQKIEEKMPSQREQMATPEALSVKEALAKIEPLLSQIRRRLYDEVEPGSCFADDVSGVYAWMKEHSLVKTPLEELSDMHGMPFIGDDETDDDDDDWTEPITATIDLIIKYIRREWKDNEPMTLYERLNKRASYLSTLSEADLINSKGLIKSQVFIMTIHKAKGLEFENVVIPNVCDGIFPNHYSQTEKKKKEDARKLYVALTRATKRVCITYPARFYSNQKELSPFIANIKDMFYTG